MAGQIVERGKKMPAKLTRDQLPKNAEALDPSRVPRRGDFPPGDAGEDAFDSAMVGLTKECGDPRANGRVESCYGQVSLLSYFLVKEGFIAEPLGDWLRRSDGSRVYVMRKSTNGCIVVPKPTWVQNWLMMMLTNATEEVDINGTMTTKMLVGKSGSLEYASGPGVLATGIRGHKSGEVWKEHEYGAGPWSTKPWPFQSARFKVDLEPFIRLKKKFATSGYVGIVGVETWGTGEKRGKWCRNTNPE